jgi:hypothetical protein
VLGCGVRMHPKTDLRKFQRLINVWSPPLINLPSCHYFSRYYGMAFGPDSSDQPDMIAHSCFGRRQPGYCNSTFT